ncbi:G patch domain-containing protein 4 [Brachionichthys hirsutus]|uniref:G patch domain-containing protein 4 n=1 Tax=Brachionichthys hirsutus TaxID=412623 RepID=UPI003604D28B
MAEVVQEKSRGSKFAERQLLRHGWEHGKGLGRSETGISEAIKVKVKCGKGGVGHKEGEQFSFHWWDHVFNKASSTLQVESDQNGVQLKTLEEDKEDGMISNKKPRKAALAKAKLYGCFVKSATLLSGQEQPEPKSSGSDDGSSSEEEDEQKLDLSSAVKLSDADLMKACGGRTAHKGARHGLTMSAKLARLEQQEAEFMAKYGKKSQSVSVGETPPTSQSAEVESQREKKRAAGSDVSESPAIDAKPRKKKKATDAVSTEGGAICAENGEAVLSSTRKRKRKKKKKQNEEEFLSSPAADSPEETAELHTDRKGKRKKSKSPKDSGVTAEEETDTESNQSALVRDCVAETKEKKSTVVLEEGEVTENKSTAKQRRKKCKKNKRMDGTGEEALPAKKGKKSKE